LEQPDDLRVAATYQPGGADAAVGGDWYDVITLGGGRTALVIGDVMGRGMRAAAVMGQLRTAVRAYARLDLPPHEVLQLLDGLAERRGQDIDEGLDALARTFAGATGMPDVICARLLRAMGVTPDHDDDVAALVFQLPEHEPERAELFRSASLDLLGGAEAVS